jgi:predicted outer membrane repeat protein
LTPGSTYSLTGAYGASLAGLPAFTSQITIRGSGARIERVPSAPDFRLMTVNSSGTLTLESLTLSGGRTLNGGAIFSSGVLIIGTSTLTDNIATGGGGALYLDRGTATISDTTMISNIANNGGAIYVSGAALTLQAGVALEGNRAGNFGGGLLNFAGDVTFTGTVLRENTALRGGGLYVSSTASVTGSQVSLGYNTASISGGGLETDSATVSMTGGCFVGNNAASGTAARSNQPTAIDLTSNYWGRDTGPLPEELSGALNTIPFLTVPPSTCVITAPIRGLGLDAVR